MQDTDTCTLIPTPFRAACKVQDTCTLATLEIPTSVPWLHVEHRHLSPGSCTLPRWAHQEVEDVGAGDGGGDVVPLQSAPLVLLRVRPRAVRQLQNEHLARLHPRNSIVFRSLGIHDVISPVVTLLTRNCAPYFSINTFLFQNVRMSAHGCRAAILVLHSQLKGLGLHGPKP